jgi:hypothetical protein
MKTPQNIECPYFFGDYFRGRNHEECRLISDGPTKNQWDSKLCKNCPVPGIVRANACQNLVISASVDRSFLGIFRYVKVTAFCTKSNSNVKEPEVGCGLCHPLDDLFKGIKD